ncbi:hypothetical protein T459_22524 [Capsicum annuum]|uniref:Uncharacterized protein n=1 Tax=Capsicum annuum TaxID=4072 RepID=A0A2G2YPR8_CAPAN|nr:hypothetical protein FXO37_03742 [Capsicum annuum]PHT71739.1 hypothetical protein T459_22524 [Capsicum annuum]
MAKKKFLPIVICIFLLVNLCLASSENTDSFSNDEIDTATDSFSNDEIDTAETNMELDWWFPWYYHRWFHPRPWAFAHPPKPSGGFRYKFPSHPWFKHPPRASTSSKSEIATTDAEIATTESANKELDWWFPWYYHRWFHPRPWAFAHPPMSSGSFRHKLPYHPWPKFKHPPRASQSKGEKNN